MAKTMMLQRKIVALEKKLLRERRLNTALHREMIHAYSSLLEPLEKLAELLMHRLQADEDPGKVPKS